MKIELKPGERLEVAFYETDGLFVVTYGEADITIFSELPGNRIGGEGVIYHEHFGLTPEEEAERQELIKGIPIKERLRLQQENDDEGSD